MTTTLIEPYGGALIDLLVTPDGTDALKHEMVGWPSWSLTERQLCDLELLTNGGFSPLRGFMGRVDHESVCTDMRLGNGLLWPIPVVLDVTEEVAKGLGPGAHIVLRDPESAPIAICDVEEVWQPDREAEAHRVYGTASKEHPGVAHVLDRTNPWYVGGTVRALELPRHYDFKAHRLTPAQLREGFARDGWRHVVAFQTRNPMHRAHFELTMLAMRETGAHLLVHPVVGMTKPGDVDHYTRVRAYSALMHRYPPGMAKLSLLPLSMRMGGPREAIWHAIIRRNHGCTHLIVGRDHAGPGSDSRGKSFYAGDEAQEAALKHQDQLGVQIVPFSNVAYVEELDRYVRDEEVPQGARVLSISGTELRRRLTEGKEIPEWFTFGEVAEVLRRRYPPRHEQGFTVFFTGLPSSGKSTIANTLMIKLMELGERRITLLDGDVVRAHLSKGLGFTPEDRETNIRRIGFVASEITKNGGVAICAPIAPYDKTRKEVRAMIEPLGGFILVHVATPVDVCEERDVKGLYKKARAGVIEQFTGVNDPYEAPEDAEITIDTTQSSAEEAAQEVLFSLEREGFVGTESER